MKPDAIKSRLEEMLEKSPGEPNLVMKNTFLDFGASEIPGCRIPFFLLLVGDDLSHLWVQHEHLAHCLIRLGLVGQLANLVQAEHVLALLLLLLLLLEHRLREARASLSVS